MAAGVAAYQCPISADLVLSLVSAGLPQLPLPLPLTLRTLGAYASSSRRRRREPVAVVVHLLEVRGRGGEERLHEFVQRGLPGLLISGRPPGGLEAIVQ